MASTIAARINPELANCISETFFGENGLTRTALETLLGFIAEFPTYHPSSVALVVIERECGGFD